MADINLDTFKRRNFSVDSVNYAASETPKYSHMEWELRYENILDYIAKETSENSERLNIMLISGPSSSGKTTTSLKLVEHLRKYGIHSVTISLDDFYLNRDEIKLDEDGSPDLESVEALDVALIHKCLSELIEYGETDIPQYDFNKSARSGETKNIKIGTNDIAIVEGIHALSDTILSTLDQGKLLKIYTSVRSNFVDFSGNIIMPKRNVRLVRRIVRDYKFRNSSCEQTLNMWKKVCDGEDKYIIPFSKNADFIINSTSPFDPCLFKDEAVKYLSEVDENSKHFAKVNELISQLSQFVSMDSKYVPETSLLREFLGGSIYHDIKK